MKYNHTNNNNNKEITRHNHTNNAGILMNMSCTHKI